MSGIQQGLVASLGGAVIELADVFNATVYEGNGAARTITTDVDTSTYGGLVWIKNMERGGSGHALFNTANGGANFLTPSGHDNPSIVSVAGLTNGAGSTNIGFTSAGFTLGTDTAYAINNFYVEDYVAWTFRKAAKFFDVVTYTGNGVAGRTVAHNLGAVPGCIIIKATSIAGEAWQVYHRRAHPSDPKSYPLYLNTSGPTNGPDQFLNRTAPTSTEFTVGAIAPVNQNGATYVAFIFAHEAGGFGESRALNAVSCGKYTGTGTTVVQVNCGFASPARFVLIKGLDAGLNWYMFDSTRGIVAGNDPYLLANTSSAQQATHDEIDTFSTGFEVTNSGSGALNLSTLEYIYIAIA